MAIVEWRREQAVTVVDPLVVDELDGVDALVLDDVRASDDQHLGWVRSAPCVVIGRVARDEAAPANVDVVVGAGEDDVLTAVTSCCAEHPAAARALVDVLRAMPQLDVPGGIALEAFAYSTLLAGDDFAGWLRPRPPARPRTFRAPPLRVRRDDDVLQVVLARPENRNAFSAQMRDALVEILTAAVADASLAEVVLSGDGPVFSSGGDLDEFGTTPDVVRAREIRVQRSPGLLLDALRPRSIAVVHGPCVGAGLELAAFAHRVIADPSTTFRLPEIGMGLIPGAGGTVSLTRRIGRQATARLALVGDAIEAEEARSLGLVDVIRPVVAV